MSRDDIELQTEKIIGNINKEPLSEHVIVNDGIEKYIEVPCLEACLKLWSLNITTFESSGNNRGGWIAISYNMLSEENKSIFMNMIKNNIDGYSREISYKGYDGIYVLGTISEEEVSSRLLELASVFQMQDIKYGVMSVEDYFMKVCNCANYQVLSDGTIELSFAKEKMVKSFDKYLLENGGIYSEEENKVYLNSYYYNKHLNYLNSLKETREKLVSSSESNVYK
jgi:hypothetical protein